MFLNSGITFHPLGIRNPLYSTSATASLNVKEMMLAILKLSNITLCVTAMALVCVHVSGSFPFSFSS
uniref:ABAH3 n=1 Tax=Arundo donax TaxID=35708 RepID=A0A0A9GS58_ARUDO